MAVTIAAAVAIGTQAPKLYMKWQGNSKTGDFSEHVANQPQRLTLYGTTTCTYCAKARAHLIKAGIPFNDRIIDRSKEASDMFDKLKEGGVPVLVSAQKLVIGFDESDYNSMAAASLK